MGIQGIQHKWEVWGSWRGIWKGRGIQEGGSRSGSGRVWEGDSRRGVLAQHRSNMWEEYERDAI